MEQQKLEVTRELAGSACNEKQRQAAFKMINNGAAWLASLNLSIETNLKEFIKENKKIRQIPASYRTGHEILKHCKVKK